MFREERASDFSVDLSVLTLFHGTGQGRKGTGAGYGVFLEEKKKSNGKPQVLLHSFSFMTQDERRALEKK